MLFSDHPDPGVDMAAVDMVVVAAGAAAVGAAKATAAAAKWPEALEASEAVAVAVVVPPIKKLYHYVKCV